LDNSESIKVMLESCLPISGTEAKGYFAEYLPEHTTTLPLDIEVFKRDTGFLFSLVLGANNARR
jgi:hypothetical protein